MARATALLLLSMLLAAPPAHAARGKREDLVRVVTPITKSTASAHPFVNIRVGFSADADIDTFHARLGGTDITGAFVPVVQNGETFLHAEVEPPLIHLARKNRLRLEVKSVPLDRKNGRPRRVRDVDRVRFRAAEMPNQPPTAVLVPVGGPGGIDAILPGVPFTFRGEASDPDLDRLEYSWDFGDGETSSEQNPPAHDYSAGALEYVARFTVSDGQAQTSDERTLVVCPDAPEGSLPGRLRVEGTERLEFGAVAAGASAQHTLTVRNTSSDPLSILTGRDRDRSNAAFGVDPSTFTLGPGQSAPVTVTFAPSAEGHQSAEVVTVASASNSCVAHLLAHGFGGAAPATGPTFARDPVFYTDSAPGIPGIGTFGIASTGNRFYVDNTVRVCSTTFDYCVDDHDCVSGGTCLTTSTCVRGDKAGQPCSTLGDCPGGFCPAQTDFEVLDMCSDGQGNLFLMSDEGTFTDPSPGDTELSGSLLRISFDDTGARTGAEIPESRHDADRAARVRSPTGRERRASTWPSSTRRRARAVLPRRTRGAHRGAQDDRQQVRGARLGTDRRGRGLRPVQRRLRRGRGPPGVGRRQDRVREPADGRALSHPALDALHLARRDGLLPAPPRREHRRRRARRTRGRPGSSASTRSPRTRRCTARYA